MRRQAHRGARAPELLHGRPHRRAQTDDFVELLRVFRAACRRSATVHLRVESQALDLPPRDGFHLQLLGGQAAVAGDVLGVCRFAGGEGAAEVEVGGAGAVDGAHGAGTPGSGAGG